MGTSSSQTNSQPDQLTFRTSFAEKLASKKRGGHFQETSYPEAEQTCCGGYNRIYLYIGISSVPYIVRFMSVIFFLQADNSLPPPLTLSLSKHLHTGRARQLRFIDETTSAIVACLTRCMLLLYICSSAPAFPCRAPDNLIFASFFFMCCSVAPTAYVSDLGPVGN